MKRGARLTCFGTIAIAVVMAVSCLDPFTPHETTQNLRYLVVEGFLNSSADSCIITLSRTIPTAGPATIPAEKGAQVNLVGDDGSSVALQETKPGLYKAGGFTINPLKKYGLTIITSDEKSYASDLVPVVITPPIDSVSWKQTTIGISISVTTHDSTSNSRYYNWKYVETWQYHSRYFSSLDLVNQKVVPRTMDIYDCWTTQNSSDILISSSTQLSQDIISDFQLIPISWPSIKLETKYSVLVNQRALTQEEYNYLSLIKKNTENLGTLFDPLPSTIHGNLHCTSNPAELVIGYFGAGGVTAKRIFISRNEIDVPKDITTITGYENCAIDTFYLFQLPPIPHHATPFRKVFAGSFFGDIPFDYYYIGDVPTAYLTSAAECVDCRYQGGTTTQPAFWK
jgi:hypothetical protein